MRRSYPVGGRCARSRARFRWILMQDGRLLSGRTEGVATSRARTLLPLTYLPRRARRYDRSAGLEGPSIKNDLRAAFEWHLPVLRHRGTTITISSAGERASH